ncbi:MAG: GNAT family N-acetyltransferase [Anaerolineales bacterium]|nr:GNAT family N-acetyltransferase [Anaerolineales bacterium]
MKITIRRAQQSDLDQLVSLWQELAELHADLLPEFALAPAQAQNVRAHLTELLRDNDERVFVAEENGALIGFINGAVRENPPVFTERYIGYIADAIVTARSRRRGVGEQLVQTMNVWFRECGVRIVHLSAATGNPISQAFWRNMGFAEYMTRMRKENL